MNDFVKNYGMAIVNECYRAAAFTFERILKSVNARHVYGLTATPTRKDGHHPIINMQCDNKRVQLSVLSLATANVKVTVITRVSCE